MFTVCRLPQQLLSHQRYLISLDLWSTFAVALCRRCLTSGSSTFWTTSPVCSLHSFILSFVLFSSFFCSLRSLVLCVLLLFTFFDLCVLLLFVFFCSLHSFDLCVLLLFAFFAFFCSLCSFALCTLLIFVFFCSLRSWGFSAITVIGNTQDEADGRSHSATLLFDSVIFYFFSFSLNCICVWQAMSSTEFARCSRLALIT